MAHSTEITFVSNEASITMETGSRRLAEFFNVTVGVPRTLNGLEAIAAVQRLLDEHDYISTPQWELLEKLYVLELTHDMRQRVLAESNGESYSSFRYVYFTIRHLD